jgi:hypothetical protein
MLRVNGTTIKRATSLVRNIEKKAEAATRKKASSSSLCNFCNKRKAIKSKNPLIFIPIVIISKPDNTIIVRQSTYLGKEIKDLFNVEERNRENRINNIKKILFFKKRLE